MVRPFVMTSREMPRLPSEYFAARAQSPARNSARAAVDVAMRRKPAKNASDFMIRSVIRRYSLPSATLGNYQTQSPRASVESDSRGFRLARLARFAQSQPGAAVADSPADSAFAILRHWAIHPDCADRSDREKIAWSRTGAAVPEFLHAR